MRKTRHRHRFDVATSALDEDVFEKEDFKRQIKEVARKQGLPEDVVDTVIRHFIRTLLAAVFLFPKLKKRIGLYGTMNIEVKPLKNKKC